MCMYIIFSRPRQQAWQWFKEEDKAIKDKTCPYEYPVWHFKGKTYEKMQAREATVEEQTEVEPAVLM